MAEIVQAFHRVDIDGYTGLSKECSEFFIAFAALMTRYIKGNNTLTLKIFQRVQNRHAILIHLVILPFSVNIAATKDLDHFTTQILRDLETFLRQQFVSICIEQIVL